MNYIFVKIRKEGAYSSICVPISFFENLYFWGSGCIYIFLQDADREAKYQGNEILQSTEYRTV